MSNKPLDLFKKTTSFLYREIGALVRRNHPKIFEKAKKNYNFFGQARKRMAQDLYHKTKHENDPKKILKEYEQISGLSLEDIYNAFSNGYWENSRGEYSFGGPKWAAIAKANIKLCDAITKEDGETAQAVTNELELLPHNNGLLVEKFVQL